jgi:hypothetical protein
MLTAFSLPTRFRFLSWLIRVNAPNNASLQGQSSFGSSLVAYCCSFAISSDSMPRSLLSSSSTNCSSSSSCCSHYRIRLPSSSGIARDICPGTYCSGSLLHAPLFAPMWVKRTLLRLGPLSAAAFDPSVYFTGLHIAHYVCHLPSRAFYGPYVILSLHKQFT